MPKFSEPRTEGRILALAGLGMPYRSIVKQLKLANIVISISSVSRVINNVGKKRESQAKQEQFKIVRTPPKSTPETVKRVEALCRRKSVPTQSSMAKKLGVSTALVNQIIHEDLGLKTRKKAKLHQLNER